MNHPDGLVTFLFTDIEGSTKLAQEFPEQLHASLKRHNDILNECIQSNQGFVFEIIGDAFCAAFDSPINAINAAVTIQRRILDELWNEAVIRVRIGINIGNAKWNGKGYTGYMTLSRTQRVMSTAHGSQVIVSGDIYDDIKNNGDNNFSFRDMGERRLKSLIKPEHLYQVIADGLPADFPPLKTLDARPNNLPYQTTSFIGRTGELKEIKSLIAKTRLLTLSGPGGTGKTRLALQAGADMIDDFVNGVWYAELASVSDGSLVIQETASIFGLKESGSTSFRDILVAYLKDKELLIIIDNCEHLINECAGLSESILLNCPKVKIMAASREVLKIQGETIYSVPALPVPGTGQITLETLSQNESARLFIERALTSKPGIEFKDEACAAISGICRVLEGIPFAIELAAARIKSIPLNTILERLNNRFHLLTASSRNALPRQQTLRSMIDWSYGLLNQNEQELIKRLSIFKGRVSLESAEAVCSGGTIEHYDILDLLSSLVDKSLLIHDGENYRMLEMIKEYAGEKSASGDYNILLQKKFIQYYLEKTKESLDAVSIRDQKIIFDWMEEEHDNIRAAINLCITNDPLTGAKLITRAGNFWVIRGYISEGLHWILIILKLIDDNNSSKTALLQRAGILYSVSGNNEDTLKYFTKALELMKRNNDEEGTASILSNIGTANIQLGNYSISRMHFEEALSIYKTSGNRGDIASTLCSLGDLSIDEERFSEAFEYFTEALAIYRAEGNRWGLAFSLASLGGLERRDKNYSKSRELLNEALDIFTGMKFRQFIAYTYIKIGDLNSETGNTNGSCSNYKEALKLYNEIGQKPGISESLQCLSMYNYSKGDAEKAALLLGASVAVREEIKLPFSPNDLTVYNTVFNSIRAKLGDQDFEVKFNSGKEINIDEAIKIALE